jgi:hypothetical protein
VVALINGDTIMHDVELRIRALRRRGLVEFFKVVQLPFPPTT